MGVEERTKSTLVERFFSHPSSETSDHTYFHPQNNRNRNIEALQPTPPQFDLTLTKLLLQAIHQKDILFVSTADHIHTVSPVTINTTTPMKQNAFLSILALFGFFIDASFGLVTGPSMHSRFLSLAHQSDDTVKYRTRVHETSEPVEKKIKPQAVILDPFPQAADPKYATTAPVGGNGFLVSREGGPTKEELTDENLYKIIDRTASDLEVNTLVWKCLGYRFDFEDEEWTPNEVFPKWKDRFPTPPDVVGMQRIYSKDIDGPCLRNNQALVKSIPVGNKKSYLKEYMKPFGFTGYQVSDLPFRIVLRRKKCTQLDKLTANTG